MNCDKMKSVLRKIINWEICLSETSQNKCDPIADSGLVSIASNSLDCIEKVSEDAEKALREHHGGSASSFATVNTFTGVEQVKSINAISNNERVALQELIQQPIIARIEYIDENGKPGTIFVTRNTPRSIPGYKVASYRSPIGRIASRSVGDDVTLRVAGVEQEVEVINKTKLKPIKIDEGWDSKDSEIDLGDKGKFTVISLRDLLSPHEQVVIEDGWDAWESEDKEDNVIDGIRRAVLSHMGLRDQPILDRHQDEIFRLPLDTRCYLSGPPGTGKTTTLIRRLGQKIDLEDPESLQPSERSLIERVKQETGIEHRTSWIMFSPTELLRQYVKEAFAREGFPASDSHIFTWHQYRRTIARDSLRLLRTGTGGGPFVEREDDNHLNISSITTNSTEWYEDFHKFFCGEFYEELITDATWLSKYENHTIANLGQRLLEILKTAGQNKFISSLPSQLVKLNSELKKQIDIGKSEAEKIIGKTLNRLVNEDREFPEILKQEIERQQALKELSDNEDLDSDIDVLEEDDYAELVGRTISREEVKRRYTQVVSAFARAKARGSKVSGKSRNGLLLSWLGEGRLPDEENIKTLGKIADIQSRLRRFFNFNTVVFSNTSSKYRKFRKVRNSEGTWYNDLPDNNSNICWQELDLLVLFTLRTSGEILSALRKTADTDLPEAGILGTVRTLYRNQILVDEATDFSVLQLSSMYELSHPLIRSFFICGDLNQRLTSWGIKSSKDIDWIAQNLERRSITVSYRQSGRLVRFARDVAKIGGSEPSEVELPDRLDIEGVPPVWKKYLLSNDERAQWLSDRIREIEAIVGKVPTIAVLVNNEEEVESLAIALNEKLQDINLAAAACKDGKVVGNDQDVRVFNIEYIKGLEFEAVFFVGLDQTVQKYPDLFSQYLYVGATRAATYLGVSFDNECPESLYLLENHFEEVWSS
jgi:hypothetical protein